MELELVMPSTRNTETPLDEAEALLHDDLVRYDDMLDQAIAAQEGYLSDVEKGMYKSGKRLRPIMLLLSAHLAKPEPTALHDKVVRASVSLEMLHVATLIHDDIIDRAPMRRGYPSIKAARGTDMAVLIGDLQFLQSLRGLLSSVVVQEDIAIIEKILKAGYEICLGEIDELNMNPATAFDDIVELECRYLNIIDRKTAMLFGVSCESGGALVGASSRQILALSRFGRSFGQSFQIMDDINDFLKSTKESGKEQHIDLAQKRLSLPIIYALKALPPDNALYRLLTGNQSSESLFREAVNLVVSSEGFHAVFEKARQLMIQAIAELRGFPESAHKSALTGLAMQVINKGI